jgi:hypothetical protein
VRRTVPGSARGRLAWRHLQRTCRRRRVRRGVAAGCRSSGGSAHQAADQPDAARTWMLNSRWPDVRQRRAAR